MILLEKSVGLRNLLICVFDFLVMTDIVDKQVAMFKTILFTIQQYKATSIPQAIADGIQDSLSKVMSLRVNILVYSLYVVLEK